VLLEARYRDFDDYESPEGTVPGSGFRDGGVRGQLHHEAGPGRLRFGWQGDFGRDLGRPSAEWDTDRTVYPEECSLRMTMGYDGDAVGDLQRWWLDGFLGSSRLITLRTSGMASAEERRQADISSRDWGLRASGAGAVGGVALRGGTDLYGRFGLDALETVTPAGGEPDAMVAIEDASSSDLGAWITAEGRVLAPLLLSAGLRYDRVASRNTGGHFGDRRTGANALSGTVSLVGGPVAGLTVAGQVSRGFRAPTLSQLYYRGVTGRGFVTGNPDLQPERSLQYDVAVRRPGRVRLSLYLYRYEIRDLIERYRDGGNFFFRNRGQALLRGAELEAQAGLGGGFSAELGLTAAEGHAVDDGAPLSDVPAEGLTLTLNRRLGHRGQLWARFLARARRGDPGPVERVVPGYAVLDLGGAWRFGDGVEARLLAGNLLDETYLGSPDELAVPAPGRHLVVTLSARF
jgi:outer membrane receptor protein involved in Fe transport